MTEEKNHAREQAKAQIESIRNMIKDLHNAGSDLEHDNARDAIMNDPLEVSIRSGWHAPGSDNKPEEYLILLCWGGPAVRITGNLSRHNEPNDARLEYQDWGTLWTRYELTDEEEKDVIEYAHQFYFSEE